MDRMLELPSTEKSFWRESYPESIYPQLSEDLNIDVVVVGAGITGLTSAYLLKQSGFKVAVLDKATVGGGTTGRTTGKVTSQHNLIYNDLRKRLGDETARIYGEANQAGVDKIDEIVHKEKISCNWQQEDNYVFTDDPEKIKLFQQEAKVAASLGLPASFESSVPLPFEVRAAVKFTNQAKINSQKYLLGLARAVNGGGSFVFENSNVTSIRGGHSARVKTKQAVIRAKYVVIATNVPTFPLLARGTYCLFEYPVESYIIAGKLPKAFEGMYISPDEHNYSLLPVQDNGERLLLVGGAGHFSGLRVNREARYQRLAKYAQERFGITSIRYRWSDRDYLSYDGVPLVGPLYPWSKNLYVATAFKKWGLSNGTAAAMILNDLVCGKENPWASTYYPHRARLIASIPRVVVENMRGNK